MKAFLVAAIAATFAAAAQALVYPSLTTQKCSASGCVDETSKIVFDYRWMLQPSQYQANGVTISGSSMKLTFANNSGPRVYLASSDSTYKLFKLAGQEITYEVETSELDCNMNGALYLVNMPENGAVGGTGYCDANCVGGTCCPEFDIWEANKYANAMTVHATGDDRNGCGINPYASISHTLYGAGSNFLVDTTKPFTVVTQFIADSSNTVTAIKRIYKQNGNTVDGGTLTSSCNVAGMGAAMANPGGVMAFALWTSTGMGWLDAGNNGPCPTGPLTSTSTTTFSNIRYGPVGTTTATNTTTPAPTTVPATTKVPTTVPATTQPVTAAPATTKPVTAAPATTKPVTAAPATTKPVTAAPATTVPTAGTVGRWAQCGGQGYTGPTVCAAPYTCVASNQWYAQCL